VDSLQRAHGPYASEFILIPKRVYAVGEGGFFEEEVYGVEGDDACGGWVGVG